MTAATISGNTGATYSGVEDCELAEFDPTNNYSTGAFNQAASVSLGDRAHMLVKFTGLSNITGPVMVSAVSLDMSVGTVTGTPPGLSIYKLIVNPTINQATWDNRLTATAWTTAGALGASDVNTTALETLSAPTSNTVVSFTSAALVAAVQDQINNPGNNFGFLLAESNDTIHNGSRISFYTNEGTDTFRPSLSVTYTAGGGSPTSYYLSDTFEM